MQKEALAEIAPSIAKEVAKKTVKGAKALHKLGDQLGEMQDEEVLRNLLRRMPNLAHRAELLQQVPRENA